MEKYDLSEEEFSRCLGLAELKTFLRSKSVGKDETPTAVYIAAQPGAGKTGLRVYIESEYSTEMAKHPFIEFDPDEIALYHMYYNEIQREFPKESYRLLQKFVSPAIDKYLRPKAIALRNNIIQEGTLSNKDVFLEIMDFQKNGGMLQTVGQDENSDSTKEKYVPGGYCIDINLLAVHRFESLLSCYEREQDNNEAGITPRTVTKEYHDRAYNNMLETIAEIERRGLYDRIRIFERGKEVHKPTLACMKRKGNNGLNIVQIMQDIRANDKKRIMQNPKKFIARIDNLVERVKKTGTDIQLEKIEELRQDFLSELEQYRKEEGR